MRAALILIAVVVATVAVALLAQADHSVPWHSFQPQIRDTFNRAGFTTLAERTCGTQEVQIPFIVRWHPRFWFQDGPQATIGFPDGAECYTVTKDGSSMIDCFVRYLGGRARFIAVRTRPGQQHSAAPLCSALAHSFPGLPVSVHVQ